MKQLLILCLCFLVWSCGSDDPEEGCAPKNVTSVGAEALIQEFISTTGITPEVTANGLYFVISNPGTAEKPTIDNSVTVNYSGYYRNDCVFDSGNGVTFPLSGVIAGWQQGIPLIGEGGAIQLIIPPNLGYGNNPPAGIKAGEPLIFDVTLIEFE